MKEDWKSLQSFSCPFKNPFVKFGMSYVFCCPWNEQCDDKQVRGQANADPHFGQKAAIALTCAWQWKQRFMAGGPKGLPQREQ
jgi:hypothetical protein